MPESPNAADTLAWAYYQKGIYDSAIELLQEAIKKVPENATYRYHLGLAYQRVSKVSLARQNFQQALLIDPKSKRADEIRHALSDLTSN
jgi:tetratricopeptide (TPR) repeat protein